MPSINSFMLCDAVTNTQVNNQMIQQLTSPQGMIRPVHIPGAYSFGLSVGVIGVDLDRENLIRFTITDPDGKEIQNSGDAVFGPVPFEESVPREYQGFVMTTDIRNVDFLKEGAYTFTLLINGEEVGRRLIPVFKRSDTK